MKKLLCIIMALLMLSGVFMTSCADDKNDGGDQSQSGEGSGDQPTPEMPEPEVPPTQTDKVSVGPYMFALNPDGASYKLIDCVGNGGTFTVPSEVNGKPVTVIGPYSFSYTYAQSIVLPSTVKTICDNAFQSCHILSITIPESVTEINGNPFNYCEKLTEIINRSSVTLDPAGNVITVHSGESIIKTVGDYRFYTVGNTNYLADYIGNGTRITLPESYNGGSYEIAPKAFCYNTSLVSAVLPDNVSKIGNRAFYGCTKLRSVTVGAGVTEIGEEAFTNAYVVEAVNNSSIDVTGKFASSPDIHTGQSKVNEREKFLFYTDNGTHYLIGHNGETPKELVLPASFDGFDYQIAGYAFYSDNRIRTVTVPSAVEHIFTNAFRGCMGIYEVINNSSLSIAVGGVTCGEIAKYALEVHSGVSRAERTSDGFVFYTASGLRALVDYVGTATEIVLPTDQTGNGYAINGYAFFNLVDLKKVEISNSVYKIGDNAFYSCFTLASVKLGENLSSIGNKAFAYCTRLKSVDIPSNTDTLGTGTFRGCTLLERFSTGDGLISINFGTQFEACPSLKMIDIGRNVSNIFELNAIGETLTSLTVSAGNIHYTSASNCLIEKESNRLLFSCNGDIPSSVRSIGTNAFATVVGLKSITVPATVTKIDSYAFSGCDELESITVTGGEIWSYAFKGCQSLKTVVIGEGVTAVYNGLFADCPNIESVTVSAENPKYSASGNCLIDKTSKVLLVGCAASVIPDDGSVVAIAPRAFEYCVGLTSVTVPSPVTRIGEYAFLGCTSLASVIFIETEGWEIGGYPANPLNMENAQGVANNLKNSDVADEWVLVSD